MKRLILLSLLAAGLCCASTIQATFTYNFTGQTACSTAVTTNCLLYFQAGTLSGTVFTSLGQIPLPANPSGTTSVTGTFTVNGVFGLSNFALVMTVKDGSGNTLTSNPTNAAGSVTVLPAAPSNAAFSQTQ